MNNNIFSTSLIIVLALIFSTVSFSKTTGPIPEDEEYLMEQSQLMAMEWLQGEDGQQANDTPDLHLDSSNEINQPECKIGRENSLDSMKGEVDVDIELDNSFIRS